MDHEPKAVSNSAKEKKKKRSKASSDVERSTYEEDNGGDHVTVSGEGSEVGPEFPSESEVKAKAMSKKDRKREKKLMERRRLESVVEEQDMAEVAETCQVQNDTNLILVEDGLENSITTNKKMKKKKSWMEEDAAVAVSAPNEDGMDEDAVKDGGSRMDSEKSSKKRKKKREEVLSCHQDHIMTGAHPVEETANHVESADRIDDNNKDRTEKKKKKKKFEACPSK